MDTTHLNDMLTNGQKMLATTQAMVADVERRLDNMADKLSEDKLRQLKDSIAEFHREQTELNNSVTQSFEDVAETENTAQSEIAEHHKEIRSLRLVVRNKELHLNQLEQWLRRSEERICEQMRSTDDQLAAIILEQQALVEEIESVLNADLLNNSLRESFTSLADIALLEESSLQPQGMLAIEVEPATPFGGRPTNELTRKALITHQRLETEHQTNHLLVPGKNIEGHSIESGVSLTSAPSPGPQIHAGDCPVEINIQN